jgi:hypothetical protein
MPEKPMSDKRKAHMLFKRFKAGMSITDDEMILVKQYYPFVR